VFMLVKKEIEVEPIMQNEKFTDITFLRKSSQAAPIFNFMPQKKNRFNIIIAALHRHNSQVRITLPFFKRLFGNEFDYEK